MLVVMRSSESFITNVSRKGILLSFSVLIVKRIFDCRALNFGQCPDCVYSVIEMAGDGENHPCNRQHPIQSTLTN